MPKKSSAKDAQSFESALKKGSDRFLAHLLDHALEDGWRTADDFVRHFPPEDIVSSLADNDSLRAELLVRAAKVHERLAKKKSVASGSEDLSIALDEGVCEPATILEVYQPDDRVKYLDHARLWAFVAEEPFWAQTAGSPAHELGVSRVTYILEQALEQELITLQGIIQSMTFEEISLHMPEEEVRKVLKHALGIAEDGKPLVAENLMQVVPLEALVGYLPLRDVWKNVVMAKLAGPNKFAEGAPAGAAAESKGKAAAAAPGKAPTGLGSKPKQAKPEPSAKKATGQDFDDHAFESPPQPTPSAFPPAEPEALSEAAEALSNLGRLPPNYQNLSIPILRSIESMYADLSSVSDDAEREAVIRESFPNESHLRKAMLSLIELLDPSINTNEPLIRDADVDALIKIVLFEERRREEQRSGTGSNRSNRPAAPGRRV
jgi:hypothetical protein